MEQYRRGDLVFDVMDAGPPDGPVVVLLHGFPQHNDSWGPVIERLTAQGFRCLAPNQRGYSPGARPKGRRDYRMSELVADVGALLDASGAEKVHLVGHDWGAGIAWGVAAEYPDRLATVTPVSVPHPAAFLKAIPTSRQGLASWYMYMFQLPVLPELVLRRSGGAYARKSLERIGQTRERAERDVRAMIDNDVLTAGLNYYRGMPFSDFRAAGGKIQVPTMYVWSDDDAALTAKPAYETERYVAADYRFEVMPGVSHWIPEEKPDELVALLLEWFAAHPIA